MNIIKINQVEVQVESYSKTTYLDGMNMNMNSNASCNVLTDNIDELNDLMQDKITSIQIYHDNELIYDLSNIDANISSISEYLNDDHMSITLNFSFNT